MKDYELEMLLDHDLRDSYGPEQFGLAVYDEQGSTNVFRKIADSPMLVGLIGVLLGIAGTLATQKAMGSANVSHNKLAANYQKIVN